MDFVPITSASVLTILRQSMQRHGKTQTNQLQTTLFHCILKLKMKLICTTRSCMMDMRWQKRMMRKVDHLLTTSATFQQFLIPKSEIIQKPRQVHQFADIGTLSHGLRHKRHINQIGSKEFRDNNVIGKVKTWTKEIAIMADIAKSQLLAAYWALAYGLKISVVQGQWL